ncbi:uncharacterized protein LOC110974846 [Acanthaster planci]|uniref:Uncharacterized protein LOC110974846 n=1 Tax=Acanthaster planci TaxID=133434 RepID=A0A8B7XR24_ACAPL|nr:uncharacterized protein LOC110974846 [Acanthaster planci]
MYPVTNMAARSDRGNTGRNAANPGRNNSMTPRDARTLPSTGTRPVTKSATSTGASRHPASTDKRASVAGAGGIAGYRDSKVATSRERLIGSGSSTRAASYQDGYSTSTHITDHATQAQKISFILLVDKEFKVKPSSSLLNQRHTPLTKKILKGTLLEGYEVSPAGQKYVDKVKGVKQTETKHYIVKPLSGDLEFESNSSEVARISTQERDFLRALFTDSHRLQIYLDKDHISYALSLRGGSQVKVLHRPDSTAPYEEVTAIVRYIGPVSSPEMGTLFGLELAY